MASSPTMPWQIDRETMETVAGFIFMRYKITVDGDCSHETKRRSLEKQTQIRKLCVATCNLYTLLIHSLFLRQAFILCMLSAGHHSRILGPSSKNIGSVQIRSVTQSWPTLCNPMNSSMPGLPVQYQLPEFTETHIHRVSDTIQPSHPLSSHSPLAPNPSQHQSLFQRVKYLHEMAKVLEFQL